MKIGIFIPPTSSSIGVPALAREVENLGFDSFWVPEHPVIPATLDSTFPEPGDMPEFFQQIMDPFVCLGAAAAVTSRILLGTAVCLVPERNPLITAKEVATLDNLSGGRFQFGIGAGWLKGEGEALGTDWPKRWTQTHEYISAMKACWAGGAASHGGSYANFQDLIVEPKPVQSPHPPGHIAGELEKSAVRVADFGDGWIPRYTKILDPALITKGREKIEGLYRDRGRDPSTLQVTLFGCKPDKELHHRFADAGVDRVIQILRHATPQKTLERLNIWADELLKD